MITVVNLLERFSPVVNLTSSIVFTVPVSPFECVSDLSVYPVEIRSVNNLSSSEDCSTDYCQPV